MSRKVRGGPEAESAVDAAVAAASEAARTLQARQQAVVAERKAEETPVVSESKTEPQSEFRQPDEKRVKRGNLEREAMLDEIRQKRGEPKGEKKPEEEKAPEPVEAKKEPEVVEPKPEPEKQPEAPKTVKAKVDGVEEDVDEKIVEEYGGIKGYQIAKAAENRLAKAKELTEENRKTQGQLAQIAEMLHKQHAPKPEPQVSDKEFIASKLDTIRFGTADEASAAFAEIISRGQPKQQDSQAIIQQATMVIENKRAVEEFKKEFSDIVGNPMLNRLAITLEREYIAKLPQAPIDWGNFYRRIGNEIRTAVPRQSQPSTTVQPTAGNSSQPSEKEARKSSIVNLPTASGRAELPKEEKQPTREESLNLMRKRRGQQPL